MKIRASSMSRIMGYLPDLPTLKEKLMSSYSALSISLQKKKILLDVLEVEQLLFFIKDTGLIDKPPTGCKTVINDFINAYDKYHSLDELPDGAKSYVEEIFIQEQGLDLVIEGIYSQTQKGNLMEDSAIALLNDLESKWYEKNKYRAEYDLDSKTIIKYDTLSDDEKPNFAFAIAGECDIYSEFESLVRDIKCPENFKTFTDNEHKKISSNYYWQLITYSLLWNVNNLKLDFCLMTTPYEVYKGYSEFNQQKVKDFNEKVSDLAIEQRIRTLEINPEEVVNSINKLLKRAEMCKDYYKTLSLDKLIYGN
jgi:hypothetical protein